MDQNAQADALADFASILADKTRAAMCLALLDGRAWTAGELAARTGVAPSTATEHLNRLVLAGVLTQRRQGRHRYVQLAGRHMAELIEGLAAPLQPDGRPPQTGFRAVTATAAMARARTCYDHLAGRLGVAVTDAMIDQSLIDISGGFSLTPKGFDWFENDLAIDTSQWRRSRREIARECLDWTERRSHLSGVAGGEICRTLLKRDWLRRIGTGRAVRTTPVGRDGLHDLLGIDTDRLDLG